MKTSNLPLDVSVIMVNYNGGKLILEVLSALYQNTNNIDFEVILVDNASTDGSVAEVIKNFPQVKVIENADNLGFAKANNIAIRISSGRYVLLLNPDAIIQPDSIGIVKRFMDEHPSAGICGSKVLLPNGKLDVSCRRSFKTPATYFYKMIGLSRFFPKSKRFGRYYLSYLDENDTSEVDSVIGAFLMIRRDVIAQIGLLDERFYIYCEDEDWCFSAKKAGWEVWYVAESEVIHHKGSSTKKRKMRMIYEWHKAVLQFHMKNIAPNYFWFVNWLVYIGIGARFVGALALEVMKRVRYSLPNPQTSQAF